MKAQEMKVCAVILNYNDADTAIALVEAIRGYEALDSIVVVDNASTDGSYLKLCPLRGGKVHVIGAKRNGGYGAGNNLGIRYAARKLQATHVLVANPDVEFTEVCVRRMMRAFEESERCGVTSVLVRDPAGQLMLSSWKLLGFWGDLLETGLVTRRLLRRWLQDDPEKYEAGCGGALGERETGRGGAAGRHGAACGAGRELCAQDEHGRGLGNESGLSGAAGVVRVGAVPGSLFMAEIGALMDCGLFDEHVFLYYEEKILGQKMRRRGYETLLLTDQSYIHRHSVSIDKSVQSILKRQELQHESKLYYYKKYLRIKPLEELAARIGLNLLLAEIWFLTKVLKMSW